MIGSDEDPERFWTSVGVNLKAGKLRLIFVADEIPPELRRIVEFLNEQMNRTEVLALEVRQYVEQGGTRLTLVPRLIGQTEAAQQAKGKSVRRVKNRWTSNPIAVGFFSDYLSVDFSVVRGRRSPAELKRLVELIRQVPGADRYLEGIEDRDFRALGGMNPEVVLASDQALEAFKSAVTEAVRPPDRPEHR